MRLLSLLSAALLITQWLYSCGLVREPTTTVLCAPNCDTTTTVSSRVGGKLAQSYVKEAQVWADRLVGGDGNLEWDAGEPLALSGDGGDYQLRDVTGEFMLVTSGGKKQDSSGNWIDAAPMVAPAPEPGQSTTNVTPLTTLVAFEPALKAKLAAYGDWNADIASPSGVSGNLLRIAKTVETLSSTLSGGNSPVVSDFGASLKSLGKLATQLNSATGDLADEEVLKETASNAITAVVSDPALVPNPPTEAQKTALTSSMEQAVQGIANVIPATDEVVVEDPTLLFKLKEVMDNASITETVSVKVTMGNGLRFAPVIEKITMSLENDDTTLALSAKVSNSNPSNLSYDWSIDPRTLNLIDSTKSSAQILGFDNSNIQIFLLVTDSVNSVDIASCAWGDNPTVCDCMNGQCN